ncbi:MAG: AcrR family transcriptional regulator [Candidatus Azotimanducaceae bacterium]|jgi:AcrR family transcriptional regulator
MPKEETRPTRGRPKTLARHHVLETAMMSYWMDGTKGVAIGEVCRRAGASKPGVYREFGSDDGLKEAVLDSYRSLVMVPMHDILARDEPFDQVLKALLTFTIQDRRLLGMPDGCLHAAMRARRNEFGELTRAKVDALRQEMLDKYRSWIDRAKANGQFRTDIPTDVAAHYFDAQNGSAMRLQKEGVPNELIGDVLRLAFSSIQ